MALVGALDQGTTSTRFIVFDIADRQIVASHQLEHKQLTPQPGWLEHDPLQIVANAKLCMTKALEMTRTKRPDASVKTFGITNQRETTVAWSRTTGKPLYNAIVWSDARTAESVDAVAKGNVNFARERCGLPCSTYFSATKMHWMLKHVPAVREANQRDDLLFGTIDTWLIWCLTEGKVFVTDCTNASRTMLMNLHSLKWDESLCDAFGVKPSSLARIASSSERVGIDSATGMTIGGIIGDQQGALFGQMCFNKGMAKNTYGTGCFLLMNVGSKPVLSKSGLLSTVAFKVGKEDCVYALEGSVAGAGSAIQWLRDKLEFFQDAKESEELAKSVPHSAGVVVVPAFSGLLAPYWDPSARGVILGLTQQATKAHVTRAMLEAVAQQVTHLVSLMEHDSNKELTSLAVDGGMSANALLMQMQADSLGKPLRIPTMVETTALGAALCAAIAEGLVAWPSVGAAQGNMRTVNPTTSVEQRRAMKDRWDNAVKRSFGLSML